MTNHSTSLHGERSISDSLYFAGSRGKHRWLLRFPEKSCDDWTDWRYRRDFLEELICSLMMDAYIIILMVFWRMA